MVASQQVTNAIVVSQDVMDPKMTPEYIALFNADGTPFDTSQDTEVDTLSNKRITPRVLTIVSSATPTVNSDLYDDVSITAQAAAITSMTSGLTGTPTDFDKLIFRIKDNGTNRAITWGAKFEPRGVALPTTTAAGKVLRVTFEYDTVSAKWGCINSLQEA